MKDRLFAAVRRKQTPLLFVLSSITLTAADYLVSFLFHYVLLPDNVPLSVLAGYFTGALVGFVFNRNIVFKNGNGHWALETFVFIKYAAVWMLNFFIAQLLVGILFNDLHVEFWLARIIVGLLLYVPNYYAQRLIVFHKEVGTPKSVKPS